MSSPHLSRTAPRPRVLSGMRPTGSLHLGNYMGALHNWVRLQHDYDCYFFIADLHALTTDYADPSRVQQNIFEIALDFLAAGLDPGRSVIFKQSDVKEHDRLLTLFGMFTPLGWLERVPSYKDQQQQLTGVPHPPGIPAQLARVGRGGPGGLAHRHPYWLSMTRTGAPGSS